MSWITIKEHINDVKQNWKEIPNSVKFWNGLLIVLLTIASIIDINFLRLFWAIGSLLTIGLFIDGDEDRMSKQLWIWLVPITWIVIGLVIVIGLIILIYQRTIAKFNDWLDHKKD